MITPHEVRISLYIVERRFTPKLHIRQAITLLSERGGWVRLLHFL